MSKLKKPKPFPGPKPIYQKKSGSLQHGYYQELVEAAYDLERDSDGTYGQKAPPKAVRVYLHRHGLTPIPREIKGRIYQASWKARGNIDFRRPTNLRSKI